MRTPRCCIKHLISSNIKPVIENLYLHPSHYSVLWEFPKELLVPFLHIVTGHRLYLSEGGDITPQLGYLCRWKVACQEFLGQLIPYCDWPLWQRTETLLSPSSHREWKDSQTNCVLRHIAHLESVTYFQEILQVLIWIFVMKPIKLVLLLHHLNKIWLQLEVVWSNKRTNYTRIDTFQVRPCLIINGLLLIPGY